MATAPPAVRGLSTEELQTIRDTVAAGRRPKVMFTESAGQIAGQVGQVVELTDPAQSDEWLVVRFGRDELPFSPTDLAIPLKAPRAKRPQPAAGPATPTTPSPVSTPPSETTMPTTASTPAPRQTPAGPATPSTQPAAQPAAEPRPAAQPAADARPAKRASRAAKAKTPPGLTVTLAYTDGEWTVAAHQGSRVLAKPYVIKPTDALQMVALLDVPGVHGAVEQIVTAERAEAERQAEKLRAELAEVEARLAELREAG